eukprot:2450878-Pyramimonas_sp.AAC.1
MIHTQALISACCASLANRNTFCVRAETLRLLEQQASACSTEGRPPSNRQSKNLEALTMPRILLACKPTSYKAR